jgi:hypothetical protein
MSSEWASRFKQFALAVDYVDDSVIDEIKELLKRYFEETLETCHYRFLMEGPGTETPSGVLPTLETVWASSEGKTGDVALFTPDGRSSGHLALCYEQRRALWITAPDGKLLVDAGDDLVDGWSRVKDLPPYIDYGESDARTSIIVPLRYGERLFGVMDLEFRHHIPASSKGKRVVKLIADALGRIIWVHRMTETQRDDTREAFSALEQGYHSGPTPLQRHSVFVASSARADQQVMKVVLGVLEEFGDQFSINYWRAETASGNIAEQVRGAIAEAEFGVCYISEPSEDEASKYRFLDNPNVLFEAGMLQMLHELRDDRSEPISRWVPVRESPDIAPPLPFDFAGDRVVMVPRQAGAGPIDESALAETLRKTVKEVVDDLNIG